MNYTLFTVTVSLFLTPMAGKKILWLCSWYPDRLDPFNGDFVQRHARAAALYNDIYVIHVVGDFQAESRITHEIKENQGVKEHLVYFRKVSFAGKIRNHRRWLHAYRQALKKYVDTSDIPHLVHVHVPFRDGMMAIMFKSKYKVPYIVTEHWTIYQPQNQVPFDRQKKIFRTIINWVVRNSLLLLPVSRNLGKQMNGLLTPKEFVVVENVANTDYFCLNETAPPVSVFRFIHVSTMSYQKNVEGIIDCFVEFQKSNPMTELVLVGPVSEGIRQKIATTGLAGVNLFVRGEISYREVALEMQKAHALVLFSRYENSPCSIIEALCCGLPVISTNVGGIPELIDETNGILVESNDKDALRTAFAKMKDNYGQYDRKKISQVAISRFSYNVIGKKLDAIYEALIPSENSAE